MYLPEDTISFCPFVNMVENSFFLLIFNDVILHFFFLFFFFYKTSRLLLLQENNLSKRRWFFSPVYFPSENQSKNTFKQCYSLTGWRFLLAGIWVSVSAPGLVVSENSYWARVWIKFCHCQSARSWCGCDHLWDKSCLFYSTMLHQHHMGGCFTMSPIIYLTQWCL